MLSFLRRDDTISSLQHALEQLTGSSARLVSSGRAALYTTLLAFKEISPRDEVVIPAFVCPSVARAVLKAGLKPVVADVTPSDFGFDRASAHQAINHRTLAVIAAHLFGYPADHDAVRRVAVAAGAFFVEDAAQSFGARIGSQLTGTLGDAGIFSFGMSKGMSTGGGGAVVFKNPRIVAAVDRHLAQLQPRSAVANWVALGKLIVVAALVRSHHLGPISDVWATRMRGKDDMQDFELSSYCGIQAGAGCRLLGKLPQINAVRRRHAAVLSDGLNGLAGIRIPGNRPGSEPIALRYPVVVDDLRLKKQVLDLLERGGIAASQMYGRESYDVIRQSAFRAASCPNAEFLCERMINLPTHAYVRRCDLETMIDVFRRVLPPSEGRDRAGDDRSAASAI